MASVAAGAVGATAVAGANALSSIVSDGAFIHAASTIADGSFSISNWTNYPGSQAPQGPFRLLQGTEYAEARKLANTTNRAMHRLDQSLNGLQIHEITPVKFGGSPTDPSNKQALSRDAHAKITAWWNRLMSDIQRE